MSRMTLCLLTAALLGLLSGGTMYLRSRVLGDEVRRPIGPDTWRVVLTVHGVSAGGPRVWVPTPLHLDRQRLVDELFSGDQVAARSPDEKKAGRRRVAFVGSAAAGVPFAARCEYLVGIKPGRPAGQANINPAHYAAPAPGEHLGDEPAIEASHEAVADRGRELTAGLAGPIDVAQALHRFTEQHVRVDGEPSSARACLESGKGDRLARARLLVALLRNRQIPARIVQGLTLTRGPEQTAHHWVEAFLFDHWVPMCPTYRHFGKVPSTFLVLGTGDRPAVTGRHVKDLRHAFLVERLDREGAAPDGGWRGALKALSLYQLPPGDRRLVEVLLLLPVAALIVCVFRNVIGLNSFGLFTPALIGLAFHDLQSLPGLGVFVLILIVGWGMRRMLDRYHLLQVPRVAIMLTLIMSLLIGVVVASNAVGATTTRYIALFPMVILTGMVERFWTQETEDGALASFKTLFLTLAMAMTIAAVLSRPWLVRHLFSYPETLGLVMAGQLLIGRYTGYRLTELFRFRDFLRDDEEVGYTTA
ncbi:MAG: 7TM domain-containing protein [Gemmataceae bacterium]